METTEQPEEPIAGRIAAYEVRQQARGARHMNLERLRFWRALAYEGEVPGGGTGLVELTDVIGIPRDDGKFEMRRFWRLDKAMLDAFNELEHEAMEDQIQHEESLWSLGDGEGESPERVRSAERHDWQREAHELDVEMSQIAQELLEVERETVRAARG